MMSDYVDTPSPSEMETGVEVPATPPGTVDVSLTGPGIAVAIAVAIGAYMLGKLAQIWLKDKLNRRNKSKKHKSE